MSEAEDRLNSFRDIVIAGLNAELTKRAGRLANGLLSLHLNLSPASPPSWQHGFRPAWERQMELQPSKAGASVEGDCIVLYCAESETNRYIQPLKDAVAEANSRYRELLQQQAKWQKEEEQKRKTTYKTIDDLQDRLKF